MGQYRSGYTRYRRVSIGQCALGIGRSGKGQGTLGRVCQVGEGALG